MGLKIDTGMKIVLYSKLIIFKSLSYGTGKHLVKQPDLPSFFASFLPPMKYSLGASLIAERSKFGARGAIKPPRPNERQNDWTPNESEANDDGIIM